MEPARKGGLFPFYPPVLMREVTLSRQQIQHPEVVNGKTLWIAPEVKEILDRLQLGDPALGWEGDPRLALFREDGRWVLQRLEHDDVYRIVCRSKPGLKLDGSLILHLMAHDMKKKTAEQVLAEIDSHNDAIEKANTQTSEAKMAEMLGKAYWALGKDVGHHY